MPSYPPPCPTIQNAYNFEDIIEALFFQLLTADSFMAANAVNIYQRQSLAIKATPMVELNVDMSSSLDFLSFEIQGTPERQTPNAFNGTITMRIKTTRNVDSLLPNPLHGVIRGRCRYIMSAPANLIGALPVFSYLQILELLPSQGTMDVQDAKDTDSTVLTYRLKFAINDWTFPIITEQPASVSVVHPAPAVFDPSIFTPNASLTFQWQVSINSGASWANTTDGATYSGSQTPQLTVLATTTGQSGNQFRLIIACASYSSTVTSQAATVTVT